MKAVIVTSLLLAIGMGTGSATASTEMRRVLYTACALMDFGVADLTPEGMRETDLTKSALVNAVESRLRAARLFPPSKTQDLKQQYLSIHVNITGSAFVVATELNRYIENLGYGFPGFAVVWREISGGPHHHDGQGILSIVSEHLDAFITDYLRANESDCTRQK